MQDVSFERHHRDGDGCTDLDEDAPGRPRAKPLSAAMAARVLVPLCEANYAERLPEWAEPSNHGGCERSIVSLIWSSLHAAGFKQFVCFVRGLKGQEEIVVVLADGVTSWPIRQLIPDAVEFLEVAAM